MEDVTFVAEYLLFVFGNCEPHSKQGIPGFSYLRTKHMCVNTYVGSCSFLLYVLCKTNTSLMIFVVITQVDLTSLGHKAVVGIINLLSIT